MVTKKRSAKRWGLAQGVREKCSKTGKRRERNFLEIWKAEAEFRRKAPILPRLDLAAGGALFYALWALRRFQMKYTGTPSSTMINPGQVVIGRYANSTLTIVAAPMR